MKNFRWVTLVVVLACAAAFAIGFTSAAAAAIDCDSACTADCGEEFCEDVSYVGCGCAWWCTNGEKGVILCGV